MSSGATYAQLAEKHDGVVSSSQMDYSQGAYSHPSYVYETQFPSTFGQTIALNASQTPVVINLPPVVFNLAQSYLFFQITLTAVALNTIWTYEDTLTAISHIQHYASSNQYICDLDNLQNYLKIMMKKEIALSEYLSNDSTNAFYASNSLSNAVPALRNATAALPVNPSSVNYLEPAYFASGGINTAVTKNIMFPLRLIKNTIFDLDKNLYYGQLSYLKLYFGPLSKICYMSTSGASPSSGTPVAYTGTGAIANLQLFLAVESNPLIREQLMNKVNNEGQKIYIPYVQSIKNNNLGTSQNISIQMDIGSGQALKKIVHSVFNATESLDTAYDCDNLNTDANGSKVQTYYTQINGSRLQNITLTSLSTDTPQWTDYMSHKDQLWGSVMLNSNVYHFNWFHCDDFSRFGARADQEGRPQLIAGLPMGPMPLTWTFVGVSLVNASYFHYDYLIFMKELRMSPSLVTVV